MAAPTWLDPGADARPWPPPPPAPPPAPRPRRLLPAALAGLLAAVVVFLLRLGGRLDGPFAVVVAIALVLALPTSRELARRVLIAGCLLLGWTSVLWWTPLPLGDVGRVTIELAVLAGTVAALSVAAPCRILPSVRAVDAMLPLTAVLGTWTLWPWLMVRTPVQTMGLLATGWDNVAHFSMVHSARLHGATVDALGGNLQFANYPEGFHAAVASVQELVYGPVPGPLPVELEAYPRVVALVVIGAVLTVVGGVLALPPLRRRPALAVPAAGVAASTFLLGPGATAVDEGFANFAVACALVCAAALLVVPLPRVTTLHAAALGGAVVGIATGWVLLLLLALPAVVAAALPLRRSRYRISPDAAAFVAVLVLVVIGCLVRTALVLDRVRPGALLTPGGVAQPGLSDAVVAAFLVLAGCLAVRRVRVVALAAVPVIGAVTALVMGSAQIDATGRVSYYAFKFGTALEMVLPVLAVVPIAFLLARRIHRGWRPVLAGATVALASTQLFGLAIPDGTSIGVPPHAPGAAGRATQLRNLDLTPSAADLVLRVAAAERLPAHGYYLDLPTDGAMHPALASQWYLALTDTWTTSANELSGGVSLNRTSDDVVRATAQRILVGDPDGVILVRPQYVEKLVDLLGSLHDPPPAYRVRGL